NYSATTLNVTNISAQPSSTGQESVHIHRLTTSHAPVFLINSRLPLVSAALTPSTLQECFKVQAPLLPKLRGHFAEFLNYDYLDRLRILYLTTCVGFGSGQHPPWRACVARQHRITQAPTSWMSIPAQADVSRICQRVTLHSWTRTIPLPGPATFVRHTC